MTAESHLLLALLAPVVMLVAGGCAAAPERAPGEDAPGAPAAQAAWDAWHAQRLTALAAPDGWLTLVGLVFLEDGDHPAGQGGGDAHVSLRYDGCAAPVIGSFEVDGDLVRFHPRPGAAVEVARGAPGQLLTADDAGAPSVVRSGRVSFTLVRRNGRLALRVRDAESPVRRAFRGIDRFPFDRDALCDARVVPPAPGETIEIMNVTGFLDVPAPVGGRTVIDFNRATNPPCAFTPYATCPLPPAENRLAVEITAGERAPETVLPR